MRHVSIGRGGAATRALPLSGRPSVRERLATVSAARAVFPGVGAGAADHRRLVFRCSSVV